MSSLFKQKKDQKISNFKSIWSKAFNFVDIGQPLEVIIENVKSLEENSIFSNVLILIKRSRDLEIQYCSKNVEKILGYSQTEILQGNKGLLFDIGAIEQPNYHVDLLNWGKDFLTLSPLKDKEAKLKGYYCGTRWKRKDGSLLRFLMRYELMNSNDKAIPPYAVIYYEDVTHLLKGEDYWMFFSSSIESKEENDSKIFTKFYHKGGSDTSPITSRESDVLKLIANGKSSKEIAGILNISADTVSQHRKNMIRKTMAKDSSSLVQLCKICDII